MKVDFRHKPELNTTSAWAISHSDKPIPKPLQPVEKLLGGLGCEFLQHRWSRNDVPHLVLTFCSRTYSVCYFGSNKFYRIFFPYGGFCAQNHHDCKTPQEVVDFIQFGSGVT